MRTCEMNELIGKTLTCLRVSEDQRLLVFDRSDGNSTAYKTYGNWGSETWFADIVGVDTLLGGRVLEVESADVPVVDGGRTRADEDTFYSVKLRSNRGRADIVYRNSQYGYYGGDISAGINLHTGALPEGMATITHDWHAPGSLSEGSALNNCGTGAGTRGPRRFWCSLKTWFKRVIDREREITALREARRADAVAYEGIVKTVRAHKATIRMLEEQVRDAMR